MGFAMDRYTRVFHAGICSSCAYSDSGLENNPSSGKRIGNGFACIRSARMLAVNSAYAACFNSRRPYGLELFSYAAGLFITCYTPHNVPLPPQSKKLKNLR